MIYDRINNFIQSNEKRFGLIGWSAIIALVLMIAAGIYVRPGTNYVGHGEAFEALTYDPFGTSENFAGFRILTPLISHLVGLSGRPFIILNLLFATINIGLVYLYFRKHAPQPADGLIAAFCYTFSSIILVTVYYAGFCDALTYLAIFMMWWLRKKPIPFYLFFAIGILNHESVLFLLPWLVFIRWQVASKKTIVLLEMIVIFGLLLFGYSLFREWIASRRNISFTLASYFQPLLDDPLHWIKAAYAHYWIGCFTVFKALWIIPLAALISMWKGKNRQQLIALVLPMFCAASQLVIAYDTTRMLTIGFMTLPLGLLFLFESDAFSSRRWVIPVALFNLLIPQLFTAASTIEIMQSTPVNLLRMIIENRPWW